MLYVTPAGYYPPIDAWISLIKIKIFILIRSIDRMDSKSCIAIHSHDSLLEWGIYLKTCQFDHAYI